MENYVYNGIVGSWFPLKVIYNDDQEAIVDDPKDLKNGVSFKIIETRVITR